MQGIALKANTAKRAAAMRNIAAMENSFPLTLS